jgi:hypothetical protein
MNTIKYNPFRTVGLLVGATAREKDRQVKRLRQFIEAEQEPQEDYSFPTLGRLSRTSEIVNEAASKLNLDSDKMTAALFWFYNGNVITDEPAFDALKESNPKASIDIWKKLTESGEINKRNCSAYQNLSTLALSYAFEDSMINEDLLKRGISLKLKFLDSDFVFAFKALATDETYKTTKNELQLLFLNQVQSEIDKNGSLKSNIFLEIISNQEFLAKEDFLKGFVHIPIKQIEQKINETRVKRNENKANSFNLGKALFEQTTEGLSQIKSILGNSNIMFSSVSDKVSDEILQCGIDYFLYYRDSKTDPGSLSMDLFRKAKVIAIGNIAKQRCQENTENVQEWIENKPERDKQKLLANDIEFITSKLDKYQNTSNTKKTLDDPLERFKIPTLRDPQWSKTLFELVANAKDLVESCKPRLVNLKNILNSTDELYLQICDVIVSRAQSMLVSAVNDAQDGYKNYQKFGLSNLTYQSTFNNSGNTFIRVLSLNELSQIVNNAYDITTEMQYIDISFDIKQSFYKNREALGDIKNQINSTLTRTTPKPTSSGSSGSSGCYIATMAYGDYDHPQVMILRQFRDNVLDKYTVGRWFIRYYYHYSPKLVMQLKNKKNINSLIRKSLNQFIKLIK